MYSIIEDYDARRTRAFRPRAWVNRTNSTPIPGHGARSVTGRLTQTFLMYIIFIVFMYIDRNLASVTNLPASHPTHPSGPASVMLLYYIILPIFGEKRKTMRIG